MTSKKNRVEVTFSDAEQDLWDYLEQSNLKKATFIKSIIRSHMTGATSISETMLEEKIKAAVAEVVGKDPQTSIEKVSVPDVFGGKEF